MADPTPAPAPAPAPPVDVVKAEPSKTRPVVLATTDRLTSFVVPADLDDQGNPVGDDLVVTHVGVPLSRKQATDLEATAAAHGVRLVDITPNEKD